MKLLFVLYDLSTGGAQKSLIDWALIMSEQRNIDVRILFIKASNFENRQIKSISLDAKSLRQSFKSFIKEVNLIKPDLVISTMFGTGILLLITKLIYPFKFHYIYREASNIKKSRSLINRLITYLIIFFSKKSTFNSNYQLNFYKKFFRSKISYIPNLIKNGRPIIKNRKKGVIMVGRSSKVKRFELGIKSLMLNTDEKLSIFTTLNDKQYINELNDLIKKNKWSDRITIHFNEIIKSEIYSNGDVLLLTSSFDGSPNVLLESIYWRIGIISLDIEYGPNEIFELLKIEGLTSEKEILEDGFLKKLIQSSRLIDKEKCYKRALVEFGAQNLKNKLLNLLKN